MIGRPAFKFIIGPDAKPFYVHVYYLEKTSKVLNVLALGSMKEAVEGCATLEDCSEDVFERFCQFVYFGDYDSVQPDLRQPPSNVSTNASAAPGAVTSGQSSQIGSSGPAPTQTAPVASAPTVPVTIAPAFTGNTPTVPVSLATLFPVHPSSAPVPAPAPAPSIPPSTSTPGIAVPGSAAAPSLPIHRTARKRKAPTNPWNIFLNEEYGKSEVDFDAPRNPQSHLEYEEIFLCHAELYMFADRYDIPTLRDLCLWKLHKCLIAFTVFPERVGDVIKLIEYVYQNTAGSDRLRELIAHYASIILEELMTDNNFSEGILEMAPFSKDLVLQLMKAFRLLEYRVGRGN